jgi:orotidine-5'-phosphate decarboxylase
MHNSKIIVALDFNQEQAVLNFIKCLPANSCRLKVGKELFTSYGPAIVEKLQCRGFEVFLDLKFHDIPKTVYQAVQAAAKLGVWMVNVHASGGISMLKQAHAAINNSSHRPLLIAVTLLTSLSAAEVATIGYNLPLSQQVLHLAQLSYSCGIDGVVCSAMEANLIKAETAANFLTITPGIRLDPSLKDDQQRVMTPALAVASGADYLVIGRPITQAPDPLQALMQIKAQIGETNF